MKQPQASVSISPCLIWVLKWQRWFPGRSEKQPKPAIERSNRCAYWGLKFPKLWLSSTTALTALRRSFFTPFGGRGPWPQPPRSATIEGTEKRRTAWICGRTRQLSLYGGRWTQPTEWRQTNPIPLKCAAILAIYRWTTVALSKLKLIMQRWYICSPQRCHSLGA